MEQPTTVLGVSAARKFVEASDDEWPQYFAALRRDKQLSTIIRAIKKLLDQPEHRQLAIDALKRVGLWDGPATVPGALGSVRVQCDQAPVLIQRDAVSQGGLAAELGHLLEIDEPMAAAGAQLSGRHIRSETEQALVRATGEEGQQPQEVPPTSRLWFRLVIAIGLAIAVLLIVRLHGAAG